METKPQNGSTELESFLPQDNSSVNVITKYKISNGNDLELANSEFDPFKSRNLEHPVSDCDTLTHLLKASLGTGILSMPAAFYASGLVLGIFSTVIVSIICTHCAYILVVCAHELYKKAGKTQMGFADVAEEACLRGPAWSKKFAGSARQLVLVGIFVTYFMTCSCYAVIVAKNFNYVANHYLGYEVEIRITIALLLIPLILLAYVPNLKYLAPVSMVANGFMAVGLGITLYYLVADIPPIAERKLVAEIATFPVFFSITIFAIEAIGVVMPLENNMSQPQHFTGLCGVLNQGMSGVTLVYIIVGFFGYLKYGEEIKGSVTLNLPIDQYFPNNPSILKKWLAAIRRESFIPARTSKLFSQHFCPDDFIIDFGKKSLKPDTVPSIFNFPKHLAKKPVKLRSQRPNSVDEQGTSFPSTSREVVHNSQVMTEIRGVQGNPMDIDQETVSDKAKTTKSETKTLLGRSAAQAVNILIGGAVFCTFGLQFYVCLDIAWNGIKKRYADNEAVAQYTLRTVMVVVCVSIGIAVPTIIPFVSLIGAFCFSLLGLLVPIGIEMLTFWEKGFGRYNWKIVKNVIVAITALLALVFGSKSAIEDIVMMYTSPSNNTLLTNGTALLADSVALLNNSTSLVDSLSLFNGTNNTAS